MSFDLGAAFGRVIAGARSAVAGILPAAPPPPPPSPQPAPAPAAAPPQAVPVLPVAKADGSGHWMPIDLAADDADLERDEGFRSLPYQDTVGVWTNGFGNTHGVGPDTPPVTVAEALAQLNANFADASDRLGQALPWIKALDPVRQDVLCEMAFNMGLGHLLGFKNTLACVQRGAYAAAAMGMLASEWATQVKGRANILADMMRTGVRP